MPARNNLAWLLLAFAPAVMAAPTMPSAEAIEAARRQMRDAMARMAPAVEQARRDHPMPVAAELARQPISAMPNVTAPRQQIDVAAIAARYQDIAQPRQAQGADVLVFVSLSMPRETLRLLADQAGRARGALLIRGLKQDSMRKTLAEVQEVLSGQDVPWQIDPEAFRRFGVVHAPTFVVSRPAAPCQQGACPSKISAPADTFVKIAGDVSLDYALDVIARGAGDWRGEAEARLARMKGRQ
ncbi:MAG: type-F conjugative transfer system pilin assembly protein TrbC [Pseudomonadota bacterium]|nr:type-F conjugative transfer system pilin assembly protein TrbC [Pseudomonadota bacterium]